MRTLSESFGQGWRACIVIPSVIANTAPMNHSAAAIRIHENVRHHAYISLAALYTY